MQIDDFSMVIPTYNRPRMLASALASYAGSGVDFRIVVADSSSDDIQAQNARMIEALAARIAHVRYPAGLLEEKFFDLPGLIETPFAMYAADDDIVFLEGALLALKFLRANPDFSACHGTYYNAALSGVDELRIGTEYHTVSLDQSGPLERILALCQRYQAISYSVQRRETFLAARPPLDTSTAHFWELYNAFAILVEGKLAALQTPYMARNAQLGASSKFLGHPMNWLLHDSTAMAQGYQRFRTALEPKLAPFARGRSAGHCLDLAYMTYLHRALDLDTILSTLDQEGDIAPGTFGLLKEYAAIPNTVQPPPERVNNVLRSFMAGGWPLFG